MSAHRSDALFTLGGSTFVTILFLLFRLVTDARHQPQPPKPTPAFEIGTKTGIDGVYKVVSISDGDTIDVLIDERTLRLRFAEIDTPEKGQPFGKNAKQGLSDLIAGRNVRVVVDDTDRYGRAIAHVYAGDVHVNKWMVQQGLAWHYKAFSDSEELALAENEARQARRGLWSDHRHIEPWKWRRLSKVERNRYR